MRDPKRIVVGLEHAAHGAGGAVADGDWELLDAVLLLRFTTVRLPAKSVCPIHLRLLAHHVHGRVSTSALLAPPGMGDGARIGQRGIGQQSGLLAEQERSWAQRQQCETEAVVPPHSGPQFSMYAVLPSAEKTALMGPVEHQRRAVVVAGGVHVIGTLRLEQAPAGRVLRLAVDCGLGPGGRSAGVVACVCAEVSSRG
jgi:hypothetical protein